MENIVNHFGRIVELNGIEIKWILDKKYLIQQSRTFVLVIVGQFKELLNALELGSII